MAVAYPGVKGTGNGAPSVVPPAVMNPKCSVICWYFLCRHSRSRLAIHWYMFRIRMHKMRESSNLLLAGFPV